MELGSLHGMLRNFFTTFSPVWKAEKKMETRKARGLNILTSEIL